jgi:hypothetical protein
MPVTLISRDAKAAPRDGVRAARVHVIDLVGRRPARHLVCAQVRSCSLTGSRDLRIGGRGRREPVSAALTQRTQPDVAG